MLEWSIFLNLIVELDKKKSQGIGHKLSDDNGALIKIWHMNFKVSTPLCECDLGPRLRMGFFQSHSF